MALIKVFENEIHRFVYKYINSNMYLMIDGDEALVVDPHANEEAMELLSERNVKKTIILLTHEHTDHISGIYCFQDGFESSLICCKHCAEHIADEKYTRPTLIKVLLAKQDYENGSNLAKEFESSFNHKKYVADVTFDEEYTFSWRNHSFYLVRIPGHSSGSVCIIMDEKIAFTGDSFLRETPVITRFPGGSTKLFKTVSIPILKRVLKPDMMVLPGHGGRFEVKEIMQEGNLAISY